MTLQRISKVVACALAVIVLSSCALLPASRTERAAQGQPTPTPIPTLPVALKPTYTVKRGEIVDQLEFSGRISPINEQDLFFRATGRVRSVFNKRNDLVKKGQILSELEIDNLERDLESAKLDLERAKVQLQQAQRQLDYDIKVAQAKVDMAQIRLNSLQSGASPDMSAIAIQKKEVELAQLDLGQLQYGVDPMLKSAVTRADLNVKKLEADITDSEIIAPFDGQLLSMSLTPGQAVDAYKPQATIADVNQLEVSADLISTQMEKLVEGMRATIVLVSRPGISLTGNVRRLPYPYGSGGRGTTVEDLDKSTRITVDKASKDAGFELGDLVRVTVELERKDNVLWLPPQALRIFDGRRFAVIQDGEAQRRVDVEVGIETQDKVEVKSGLKEGQVVLGQ